MKQEEQLTECIEGSKRPSSSRIDSLRAGSHPAPLIVVPLDQLRAAWREDLTEVLAAHDAKRSNAPVLVDAVALARALSVSRATVHRWRVRGCPCIPVGDTFRYQIAAVVNWLESGRAAK